MNREFIFADVIARAKECFGCASDKALATKLGMTPQTFGNRKNTESIPYGELLAVALAEGADMQYILTGVRSAPLAAPPAPDLTPWEQAHIQNLRECDKEDRDAIARLALRSAEAQHKEVERVKLKKAG